LMSDMYADDWDEMYLHKTNLNYFTFPEYFPRAKLQPYGLETPDIINCPGGHPESNRNYGHYQWHAGGWNGKLSQMAQYGTKKAACLDRRSDVVLTDRWAIAGDILIGRYNNNALGGSAYTILRGTMWSDSHVDGMNVATAAGSVTWYPRAKCNGTPQCEYFGAMYPRDMLFHNWHSCYNTTVSYYWLEGNGQKVNMYSNVDGAMLYRGWGL